MALSKAELRQLAVSGVRDRINSLRAEIARYLEEFPELMTPSNGSVPAPSPPVARDPLKPKITDQALDILSKTTEPMKAGDVFRAMQALPNPSTHNDTSVYTSLAHLAAKGLLKRTDDGYQINAKGRKHMADEATGGQA